MAQNIPCSRCGDEHEDTLGDAICCSCRKPEEFPEAITPPPVSPSKSSDLLGFEHDIIARLKEAEKHTDGETRKAIHEAWNEIAWLREGVALSRRAVEIAEGK